MALQKVFHNSDISLTLIFFRTSDAHYETLMGSNNKSSTALILFFSWHCYQKRVLIITSTFFTIFPLHFIKMQKEETDVRASFSNSRPTGQIQLAASFYVSYVKKQSFNWHFWCSWLFDSSENTQGEQLVYLEQSRFSKRLQQILQDFMIFVKIHDFCKTNFKKVFKKKWFS